MGDSRRLGDAKTKVKPRGIDKFGKQTVEGFERQQEVWKKLTKKEPGSIRALKRKFGVGEQVFHKGKAYGVGEFQNAVRAGEVSTEDLDKALAKGGAFHNRATQGRFGHSESGVDIFNSMIDLYDEVTSKRDYGRSLLQQRRASAKKSTRGKGAVRSRRMALSSLLAGGDSGGLG
jgi:hypothetical protein